LLQSSEKDILGSLEIGQAVVKLQGRATKPFLVNVPEFPIQKGAITDTDIRTRMATVIENTVSDIPSSYNLAVASRSMGSDIARSSKGELSDPRAYALLRDVNDYPESGVAARYKRIGVSVRQGQKIKAKLVEQKLIEERETRTLTGRLRVIRLTEKGQAAVQYDPKSV